MKTNINYYLIILLLTVGVSCDEDSFLEEIPKDFLSPEIAYVTQNDFDAAVLNLYAQTRNEFFTSDSENNFPSLAWDGTDMVYAHKNFGVRPDWGGSLLLPTNTDLVYGSMWKPAYQIIYDVNVIIGRSEAPQSQLTEEQKSKVQAEAAFFRGYMYKMLANLYGDVPIVLEEVTSPRRDFVRSSREEVYQQSAADLLLAAEELPNIDEAEDSRINKLAAYHLLSEVYISLGRWQEAVDAASRVIDHPGTALMTERFGSMVDHPQFGGDVYWDLFRQGNQNRSSGNTEAIWVLQFEFNVPGGNDGFQLERTVVPRLWQAKIYNDDGSVHPLIPYPNTNYYGRGSGFMSPSRYLYDNVWRKSGYDQDIRNSEFNIVRDFIVNNPSSDHNGKWVFKDNVPIALETVNDTTRNFFPVFAKASVVGQHPTELYHNDQTVPGSLTNAAQRTFRDRYVIRLAETYLLRAEAYLGMNNQQLAAQDINTVRRRASAPEVNPADLDLDYLLDERLRELHFESLRLLTLTRLGKLVERAKNYNPWVGELYQDHNNLWPIPFNEIEKNIESDLGQNPGY
ncbi:RagB/SusD family nutrient uptake outer membrane protein [Cyclobacterium sp.]|uniref:RagB/SusD family nutrient uptake outer membrane protein n=1 Tax=Cyclobacterium sp. TaxID=1966343 RepID=UPI001986624B|nr:RagB/SusD family nutrient uptake outer membrane protein [Cyclobacterium sp.]MBD3629618.1 RagB/SusD family nutrient uptake outer membrane protein [Cyclobacterium sp.]